MNQSNGSFPPEFVWGAATASYQIEGAVHEDGRGESIWDRFCETPGKIRAGDTGRLACDHYHRYPEDIQLMRDLGLRAYRFSIAWPRVIPLGRGEINGRGLDFYDRLVDELLANDIQPFVTLYHWDLPQALEEMGGWPNRDTVDAYVAYVEAVVGRLGDRVRQWITHNEPWVAAWLGYGWGEHAPGRRDERDALAAAHHLLLSHGRAVDVIRRDAPGSEVGITLNLTPVYPASDTDADVKAARESDGHGNRWFLDPIFRGEYPPDMVDVFETSMPRFEDGDLKSISSRIDFLGINNYTRHVVHANEAGRTVQMRQDGSQYTNMEWEVYPQGLYELLVRVHHDYAPTKLYITENGADFTDVRIHSGEVRDPERTRYLESHIASVGHALAEGVPMAGYFVWTLLDNFEWAHGYSKRFGIVYVDYPTLERIPKGSYYWYRNFIAMQGTGSPNGRRDEHVAPVVR